MPNNNETTTKFKVDISELKSAMQNAKRQIQVTNSEFKAISSSMKDWTKSTDGISAKLKQLNTNLGSQKTVLSSLERQYELTVAEMGEGSAEADRLKIAINNQKAVINGTEKEINKYEGALDELSNAESEAGDDAEDLGKEVKKAGDEAEKAGEGFTVFKGVLANLATEGINLALDGIKSLGSAMVDMVKQSVSAYAEYEQLTGGIETLFKDSYDTVMENANNAFKTAGMSANEYMSTVTAFSAGLIQSLGGDTAKSAEVADMAITDMANNVNKMGTSMEDVQNAYKGFAKNNYSMLDNLALGYQGTQAEMERLLSDAEKISGVKYDIKNLADVYSAIHVIQEEMGIAGTTAKEASTTIAGSVGMMKSAWTNLITGMSDENANFEQLVTNLVDSVTTMLGNVLPVATKAISGLGQLFTALAPIIATELPKLIDQVLPTLLTSISALLEAVLNAIMTSLPSITQTVLDVLLNIVDVLLGMTPQLTSAVIKITNTLLKSLSTALPKIALAIVEIVQQIIDAIMSQLPTFIQSCVDFLMAMVEALPTVIKALVKALPQVINTLVKGLLAGIDTLVQGAVTLLMAIVDAIPQILPVLISALPEVINAIVNGLVTGLPQLVAGAITLLMAIVDALPVIITALANALPDIISTITSTLLNNMPLILDTTVTVLMAIVEAIPQIVVALAQTLPQIITTIMGAIFKLIPQLTSYYSNIRKLIIDWLAQLIVKCGEGASNLVNKVVSNIKQLPSKMWTWLQNTIAKVTNFGNDLKTKGAEAAKKLFDAVVNGVKNLPNEIKSVGNNLVEGLWNGINDKVSWITNKLKGFKDSVMNALKDFFGIASPSKVMRDEIGKWLPEGIAVGIDKNAKSVLTSMKNLTANTVEAARSGLTSTSANLSTGTVGMGGVVNNFTQINNSPKALSRLEIYRQSKNLLGYAGGV